MGAPQQKRGCFPGECYAPPSQVLSGHTFLSWDPVLRRELRWLSVPLFPWGMGFCPFTRSPLCSLGDPCRSACWEPESWWHHLAWCLLVLPSTACVTGHFSLKQHTSAHLGHVRQAAGPGRPSARSCAHAHVCTQICEYTRVCADMCVCTQLCLCLSTCVHVSVHVGLAQKGRRHSLVLRNVRGYSKCPDDSEEKPEGGGALKEEVRPPRACERLEDLTLDKGACTKVAGTAHSVS